MQNAATPTSHDAATQTPHDAATQTRHDSVTQSGDEKHATDQHRDSARDAAAETELDRRYVTDQQMRESGHAAAFAKLLRDIPESIKAGGPKGPQYTGIITDPDSDASQTAAKSGAAITCLC